MNIFKNMYKTVCIITLLIVPVSVMATTGYFAHGVGIKSKAMGGTGIAKSRDALAAGTNPANMVKQGNRVDFGIDFFKPNRSTEIVGNPYVSGNYSPNDDDIFYIPEFGYNRMINDTMSVGVSVYGNGGMNTSYKKPVMAFGNLSDAGINLEQLFIAPTFSMKVDDKNTFGVSLNLIYQKFRANGLSNFDNPYFTSSPGYVTDNGDDSSYGYNVRVGWTSEISDVVTIGATYQSKADMSNFDKYKGLFAERGDLDIPSTYGFGINIAPTNKLDLALDVTKINYSEVAAISNKNGSGQLGSSNGSGFGWEDMTVIKIGGAYEVTKNITLMAGYLTTDQPIPQSQTFFNMLAPGVVEDHYTAGITYALPNKGEITVSYMYAPEVKVNGNNSIPAGFGGGEANIAMSQQSVGLAYGWNF